MSECKVCGPMFIGVCPHKPPSGPPREFWRKMYEKMSSPIDKFKYLCGLKELSWEDCQDAWFESQKLMPEIASAFDAVVAERDALAAELETYKNQFKNEVDRATEFNNAERMRLAAQLAELRLAKPNAGSTDTLTEKYRLRRERDQLKAELAEARDRWDYFEKAWKQYSALYSDAISERTQLRSACEMLAKVLESVELYPNGHTNMRVKAALAQYEALKRQLAGEGVSREPKG